MHLMPYEQEKLSLVTIGMLAQRRLARGLLLNYPEATGLIAFVLLELIRDGNHSVSALMALGQTILGRESLLPGVAEMMDSVLVEGTFPDGTKLVAVRQPVRHEKSDFNLALYGSFLPHPAKSASAPQVEPAPGEFLVKEGQITLNDGRPVVEIEVTNTDTRPVQIGSHFHFVEANPHLSFDREAAYGHRLDIPAGTSIRFAPGQTRRVRLVGIGGRAVIRGGNNLADGQVGTANRYSTMQHIRERDFSHKGA